MKVQCDVCEKAAATLLCCADEAALCGECDQQVHAANKLAEKHERVPFTAQDPSSCDICQEKSGHFFCVEDRALLCRDCDVGIHTANNLTRKHKRFLVTGVRVGLDAMAPQLLASPHSPPLLVLRKPSKVANNIATPETAQQMVPNAQEAIWPSPPPPPPLVCTANNPMENIHSSMQTFKHMVPQVTTWPSPIIPPMITPSPSPPQQLTPPPTMDFSACITPLDELLCINNTTTTFAETPSRMSIPNHGWALPNNALARNVLNASTCLVEDSLAEVPSTPSASIQYIGSLKRKRPMNELAYSFDYTAKVPNGIFNTPFTQTWWQ